MENLDNTALNDAQQRVLTYMREVVQQEDVYLKPPTTCSLS